MNMPMTVIEVSIGQSLTPLTLIAIQSKTICNHPHLRRMLIAAIALVDAFPNIVVMVASYALWVATTTVLHLMRHSIASIGIQSIEQTRAGEQHANGTQTETTWASGNSRTTGQTPIYGDALDRIGVFVLLVGWVRPGNRKVSSRMIGQTIPRDIQQTTQQ
jgi:hypothetical protein